LTICLISPSGGSLLAAVPTRLRCRTVDSALINRAWASDIRGPRTVQVILGYLRVDQLVRGIELQPGTEDRFVWRFRPNGVYSASSAYRAMFFGSVKLRSAKQLWKASAPPKVKFFFWLAVHERCWTASRRKKRGLQDCDLCVLCHQAPETMNHLLADCVFTREVWARLAVTLSLPQPAMGEPMAVDQWLGVRKLIPNDLRRGFDALFLLVSWLIGKSETVASSTDSPPCRLGFCQRSERRQMCGWPWALEESRHWLLIGRTTVPCISLACFPLTF
jgi:hypothetical protein